MKNRTDITIPWRLLPLVLLAGSLMLVVACSTTSGIPDGEQLYIGLKPTKYVNHDKSDHFYVTKEETDLVLATPPNASLFGSSTYRSPFPIGLWMWNAFSADSAGLGRWMNKTFGTRPVLMSQVSPALHASVGENTLKKRGYFSGRISYEPLPQKNPKKSKLQYTVDMGHLWTVDTIRYVNFPAKADSIIQANLADAEVVAGDPFDVAALEEERLRVTNLFRDNGFFYYDKGNASYLADTVSVPGKVQLRLQMADSLDERAIREWYIGRVTVNYRKTMMEQLDSTRQTRNFTVNYNGSRPPIRMRVLLNDLQLRPRQLYSREKHESSLRKLQATGLYTRTNMTFTPRLSYDYVQLPDDTLPPRYSDTLDVNLDLVFDKPYDFYIEAYGKGKTSGKVGPEVIVGLTKRNAFRGGEQFDLSAHGSYEWQMGHELEGTESRMNSYEYGMEGSITFPRIVNPFQVPMRKRLERMRQERVAAEQNPTQAPAPRKRRRRFYDTPTTILKGAASVTNRGDYFKRHAVSGELRYNWQTSAQSAFEFSPLTLTYEYMTNMTERFLDILLEHPYLAASMSDQFIPKASFTYAYHSPANYRHPITWRTTVSEAANVLSAAYAVFGEKWGEKNKTMFKNPYAQFVKLETDFTKTWQLSDHTSLAAHAAAGVICPYGNSNYSPYTELFYVGGANSIRAFNVRAIGPGRYRSNDKSWSYVEQTGDLKLLFNLEYRPKLFGSLYGALFLDAGNVWDLSRYGLSEGLEDSSVGRFKARNFFREMALGTGIGLRYDLDYFILRLDWGIGLHVPYETSKGGFYNIDHFKDAQTFHLAIGLPF